MDVFIDMNADPMMIPACNLNGNWHYQFRIILLGDSTVGKTSLLKSYTERCFLPDPCPTVGVEFYSKIMELQPGIKVKLQLWDTAGQERFREPEFFTTFSTPFYPQNNPARSITRSFYRNVVGVFLVFDMTNRRTFENIFEWHNEVTTAQTMENIIFLLIGHKSDLQSEYRVSIEEAEGMATSLGTRFIGTSAKENMNVDLAFDTMANAIYEALRNKKIDLQEGWDGVKVIHKKPISSCQSRRKKPEEKCQC